MQYIFASALCGTLLLECRVVQALQDLHGELTGYALFKP
jgi:hypothetical protein